MQGMDTVLLGSLEGFCVLCGYPRNLAYTKEWVWIGTFPSLVQNFFMLST